MRPKRQQVFAGRCISRRTIEMPRSVPMGTCVWIGCSPVERRYELDNLRRSLTMLSSGAQALRREDAIDLVAELEDTQERLRRLIAESGASPTRRKPVDH